MPPKHFSERVFRTLKTRATKAYRTGTHRSVTPERTLDAVNPYKTKAGITRVANVTGLDWLGIPVVMVCRPNARSLAVSQGKGQSLNAAKASALMESLELYCAEHITLPVKLGCFSHLSQSSNLVDIGQLPLVNQYHYHPHKELLWIEGYDLLQQRPIWVPYDSVSVSAVSFNGYGKECFYPSSNGLASGNHLLEAIVHGLCEVVERDAMTLWYRRPRDIQEMHCVDLDTCDDPHCTDLILRCHEAGIGMIVWETTSDVGSPCFLCLLYEKTSDSTRLKYSSVGTGCHLSRSIALARAITEAAQSRLTLISGSRDDVFRHYYEESRFGLQDLMRYRSLRPQAGQLRSIGQVSSWNHDTFNEDIEFILKSLRAVGIQHVVVVPLTEPESAFHVVKVLIPGLEGPDEYAAYSPGPRAKRLQEGTA